MGLAGGAIPSTASAASFNQNIVMDDSTFGDANSMSLGQIDDFLNSFPNSCISSNSTFRAIDPVGYNASQGFIYGGNVTAGAVIYHAAQAYGINPQVLLTTLQKEQSLVTGSDGCTGPNKYAKAAGYGCPDSYNSFSYTGLNLYTKNGVTYTDVSGVCVNSAAKAGFSQQVIRAAWLLRYSQQRALGNIGWAVVKDSWNNSDDLNATYSGYMTQGCFQRSKYESACTYYDGYATIDNTAVHMDSGAAAALYRYTPHFSGNRNFVNIFTDLFGFGPTYDRIPIVRTNGSGKFYIRGADNKLFYITSASQLSDIGYGINWRISSFTPVSDAYTSSYDTSSPLRGAVRFGSSPEVYLYALGGLHYLDFSTYQAYGSPAVAQLDGYVKNYFWVGDPASTVARDINNGALYQIVGSQKRRAADLDALAYYGFSNLPRVDTGATILGSLSEGLPLVKPGTLLGETDGTRLGLVSQDGSGQYPISPSLRNSISLSYATVPGSTFSKLSQMGTTDIGILAKSSTNDLFILDKDFKINLSTDQLTSMGYVASDFINAPDSLLGLFTTKTTASNRLLVRIDSSDRVYAVVDKKVRWFEAAADFTAFGFSFSDVINLSPNTYGAILSYSDATMVPNGVLVRPLNSSRISLVTSFDHKTPITTAYLFGHLGYSFNNVRPINSQTDSVLSQTNSITPYAFDGSNGNWLLYNGRKTQIPSQLIGAYNLATPSAQLMPWQLASLPTTAPATKFIRIDNGQNIYLIEGGTTHLLSPSSYLQNGGSNFTDLTSITQDMFNAIPAGSARP